MIKRERPVVAVLGPLPPPLHGHMVVTQRILLATRLRRDFELVHVDLSSQKTLASIGRINLQNTVAALRHALRLAKVVAKRRPALVYLPLAQNRIGVSRDLVLLAIALAGRARVVGHVHGGGFGSFLESQPPWFRRPTQALLQRCVLLVVMSEWQRLTIERVLPGVPTSVVPHGTPTVENRRCVANGAGDLRVLYVTSGLVESKGLFVVLRAARIAEELGLPFSWHVVGDWSYERDRREAERLLRGLHSIELLGCLGSAALAEEYGRADVFLFPTTAKEGFGLVRIEAMAAGLPVVTTEAGGAREVVRDGVDGYIVDYDNPSQIVDRLVTLHEDSQLRAQMGASARARQQLLYTEDAFAEALGATWMEALA